MTQISDLSHSEPTSRLFEYNLVFCQSLQHCSQIRKRSAMTCAGATSTPPFSHDMIATGRPPSRFITTFWLPTTANIFSGIAEEDITNFFFLLICLYSYKLLFSIVYILYGLVRILTNNRLNSVINMYIDN